MLNEIMYFRKPWWLHMHFCRSKIPWNLVRSTEYKHTTSTTVTAWTGTSETVLKLSRSCDESHKTSEEPFWCMGWWGEFVQLTSSGTTAECWRKQNRKIYNMRDNLTAKGKMISESHGAMGSQGHKNHGFCFAWQTGCVTDMVI